MSIGLMLRRRAMIGAASSGGRDYSAMYLTFKPHENSTFSLTRPNGDHFDVEYSLDGGTTWATLVGGNSTPTVSAGSEIIWKAAITLPVSHDTNGIGHFSSTGTFDAYGNLNSLYKGDAFAINANPPTYYFCSLFLNCTGLINAENLIIPGSWANNQAYVSTFSGCSGLLTPPQIYATGCSSYAFRNMFSGCSSLQYAPTLHIPATATADSYAFSYMFYGCKSLVTAPDLPMTSLGTYCYYGMFRGCTALKNVPATLPATTLKSDCYREMFYGCTNLTIAPILPAATLQTRSYREMFRGCSKLNYIKCLATNISASNCTYRWVYGGVASSGTFVKKTSMSSWATGVSGIPSGWTVNNADS